MPVLVSDRVNKQPDMDGEYLSQKRVGPEIDSNALFAYHSGDGKRIRFEYHKQQAHHYPSSPHMNMNYMMMGSWSPVVNLPDIPPTDHSCSSAYHCCCHHQMKNHMVDHLFESGTAMISSPANVITCLQNQMQNHSVCVPTNYNIGFQDTSPTVDCFQNEIGFWNNTPQEVSSRKYC